MSAILSRPQCVKWWFEVISPIWRLGQYITQLVANKFNYAILIWISSYIYVNLYKRFILYSWWRHQIEIFSALLALCTGNAPVTGEFPTQRPVKGSFDVFFHLRLNIRQSRQSRPWWFETQASSLWRHCNGQKMTWPKDQFHMAFFSVGKSAVRLKFKL